MATEFLLERTRRSGPRPGQTSGGSVNSALGHDNRTFRLGSELTIRLPTDDGYVAGELKEQAWLAQLAPQLPLPIPEVVGQGVPAPEFLRPWSVRRWIAGETPTLARIDDFARFAGDLAAFLTALRGAGTTGAPAAGVQSFHRGAHPRAYDDETRSTIQHLRDEIDVPRVTAVWERALDSEWPGAPVWFHGDVARGNLLVAGGRLGGVIDFGTSGVGDPALRHGDRLDLAARRRGAVLPGRARPGRRQLGPRSRMGAVESAHHHRRAPRQRSSDRRRGTRRNAAGTRPSLLTVQVRAAQLRAAPSFQ
ncbi:aminoglycoside phosphotransferase family protein [Nakamurella sp. A5-74]|uniref:Aminoglycoside phosphotransferase family protein n=1 Tax=Nakamurella sp. A5-74 TaxID=3158264 RepID=A0AAU8DN61_9ACTN